MNIRKYRRGPKKGYEVYEEGRVIDAASNEFLDFIAVKVCHFPKLPETLQAMMLERWNEE